jgi:predicted ArsR family transcriptional regulator
MAEIPRDLGLTENELVQALQEVLAQDREAGDGLTVRELADILDIRPIDVRENLRALKMDGTVETISVRRRNLADRVTHVPGYRLAQP